MFMHKDVQAEAARRFGERLRKIREALGIEQSDMARLMGFNKTTYFRYENGNRGYLPKMQTLISLADFFGVTVDWLISPDEEDFPFTEKDLKKIKARLYLQVALRASDFKEEEVPEILREVERVIERLKSRPSRRRKRERKEEATES